MTRANLVRKIANDECITYKEANRRLGIFLNAIEKAVVCGGSLVLRNFGTFTVRNSKERMGRNPKTGEPATIEARRIVKFKAGKHFKSMLSNAESRSGS